MTHPIDHIMEDASQALVQMRYADCEQLCIQAMQLARAASDYDRYARIIMPLQECRRWRRQNAVDAGIHVIHRRLDPEGLLNQYPTGCLLLINSAYDTADEIAIRNLAAQRGSLVEVMRIDEDQLRAFFMNAFEKRGDALLEKIDQQQLPPPARVDALANCLEEAGDHEIAHQRLQDAARHAAHSTTPDPTR